MVPYLMNLRIDADELGIENIAGIVLDNPLFAVCAGSIGDNAHHHYTGGLVRHTWEVWDIADDITSKYKNKDRYPSRFLEFPTDREVFLACLYHDVGKMWDYTRMSENSPWVSTNHKRTVHHISRSAIEWSKAVEKFPKYRDIEDSVLHAILAHHGRREWGSPVAPKTRLAWMLHLCDGISARMDDADTLDIINVKK
jgi:3'-5' exoribonuclease